MKYSEAKMGRVFILRLEDGEILHETVERFSSEHHISSAAVLAVGGADTGSRLVVGPEQGRTSPITAMEHVLDNVHEISGVGTIFPDATGQPVLHMHAACGRKDRSITGCVRKGVKVWHVMEIIMIELTGSTATRRLEAATGFELLSP